MRGSNMPGRFSIDDELDDIHDGMHQDLQMPVGQQVAWWQLDRDASQVDDIYDVGSSPGGRIWKPPIMIPVLLAQVIQGQTPPDDLGFYNTDSLHLNIDMRVLWRLLPTLPAGVDSHLKDRVVFRDQVYSPFRVWARGQVHTSYTTLTVELEQVKPDEMVNDSQFAQWM